MSEQEYIKDCQLRVAEWFKNHKAKTTATGDIFDTHFNNGLVIEWRDPMRWEYGMWYFIRGGVVVVSGNLGDAIPPAAIGTSM